MVSNGAHYIRGDTPRIRVCAEEDIADVEEEEPELSWAEADTWRTALQLYFFVWQIARLMASVDGMQSEPAYPAGRYFVKLKGGSYLEGDELVSRWLCATAAAAATATATLSIRWTAMLSVGWTART